MSVMSPLLLYDSASFKLFNMWARNSGSRSMNSSISVKVRWKSVRPRLISVSGCMSVQDSTHSLVLGLGIR